MENPTKSTCSQVGLIACDKGTDACPAFFQVDATRSDDQISGVTVFIIGLVLLFICLFCMVYLLQKMLMGMSSRIIYKATNINGYLAILVGVGVTILVQSSSITTSVFTPLVGMDVIRLEQMFPITLGANIGTTVTALLAALLSSTEAMQVALAHLFFNISGILVWYPIPFMRNIPLNAARSLGQATRILRIFPLIYIVICFLIIPALLLGLSLLFTQGVKGLTVLGSLITVCLVLGIAYSLYWYKFASGKDSIIARFEGWQAKSNTMKTLPEDIEMLKAKIASLEEHTGLIAEDAAEEPTKDVEEDA